MSLCDAEPVNPREPGTMPRVWSDLIINCNESLAAGWRYNLGWAQCINPGRLQVTSFTRAGRGHQLSKMRNFQFSGRWIQWFIPCCNLAIGNLKKTDTAPNAEHRLCQHFPHFCFEIMLFEQIGNLFVNVVFPFQVFCHLASQHLDEINSWSSDPPLIQIGGGGFNGFSQSTFLSNYETNWDLEQKDKKKKKKKLKKVNFDTQSYINCDTKAFFLTPLKMKNVISKEKLDFRSVCKVL